MTTRATLRALILSVVVLGAACGTAGPSAAPGSGGPTPAATDASAGASTSAAPSVPSEAPTDEPTAEPTDAPTEEPTEEPVGEPTDEPSGEPLPTPEPTPCSNAVDEGPGTIAGPDSDAPRPGVVDEPAAAREVPVLSLEQVVDGLAQPIGIAAAGDGSGRLFVIEQGGRIRVIDDGRLLDQPVLDIADRITAGGERGLLGLAFHPQYAENGRFFVNYTDLCGNTAIVEFRVSDGDPNLAEPRPIQVLLQIVQPFGNHNGGGIAFGPDGALYIATGDGGSGGDPLNNGQRLDTLLGKLLRIDVDARETDRPYGLPDNRFASRHLAQPEIFATGLRNPWRFSFDRETGDLWIGDVGQGELEEIDLLPAGRIEGANLGWPAFEGSRRYRGDPAADAVPPVFEYGRDEGQSVVGGYVYRGAAIPGLASTYLFADTYTARVRALRVEGGRVVDHRDLDLPVPGGLVASFGEDADGELYVLSLASGVHRIVSG